MRRAHRRRVGSAGPPGLEEHHTPGDRLLQRHARLEERGWRQPRQIGSDKSYFAPALAAAHGKLYYAVTGTNKTLWRRTFNGSSWSTAVKFEGHTPVCAPSLAQFQDWVWLTEIGADRRPYLNLTDGTRWRDVLEDNLKWTVDNPVAMAPHGG